MQNGWRKSSLHAYTTAQAPSVCEESSALTLNYLGILPTVSHLLSLSAQTILSAHRSVSLHPNNPLGRYPRLPAGDSIWLTWGVLRETLCVNSICRHQPVIFSPSSTEAASCCFTSYTPRSNTSISGETACIVCFFILFCCDILFWAWSSRESSSFSSVGCVKLLNTVFKKKH